MTTFDRFEREIPELMTELAPVRVPDYFDDMLRETASNRQRPAWSYPGRWLPMEITARPLTTRSFPWRPLAVVALVALLIAAGLAVYVGSQPRLPPPFGAAGNGVLLYRAPDGAIVAIDPTTYSSDTVAPSADSLGEPIPSRDGQWVAFVPRSSTPTPVIVAGIDGANRTALAGAYRDIEAVDWSPDGSRLAFVSNDGEIAAITVAATDGSIARTLPLERNVWQMRYLPDGRLAIIAGEEPGYPCPGDDATTAPCALFLVNADGSGLDLLVPAADFHGINTIDAAQDGSQILYVEWRTGAEGRLHVIDLATNIDRRLPDDGFPSRYAINRAWFSPDGTAILFDFYELEGEHWGVVPSAGGTPIRIGLEWPENGTDAAWAPDGRSVLARYSTSDTTSELWMLDATGTGSDRRLEVDVPYLPAWQRTAR
jgi:Tol biopolymer transport system component